MKKASAATISRASSRLGATDYKTNLPTYIRRLVRYLRCSGMDVTFVRQCVAAVRKG